MKCRRNTNSRGARLRSRAKAAAPVVAGSAQPHASPNPAAQFLESAESSARGSELHIASHTIGAICHDGTVIVGPAGWVTGAITAAVIVIEGRVEGDLSAAKSLRIAASARVVGDLRAPRVSVARGARLQGHLSTRKVSNSAAELDPQGIDQVLSGRI